MKGSKIWKIVWVSGIYLLLITILYLVILYKVEWENKDLNTYLYFYECNGNLCSSTTKVNNYYNKILCENDNCPYIKEIINNNVILQKNDNSYIYDYFHDKIINNTYVGYEYLKDNLYIVTDNNNRQGIINEAGNVIVKLEYDYIDDYNNDFISFKQNNLYGIENKEKNIKIDAKFDDVVLINDSIYSVKSDGLYNIYDYKDNKKKDNSIKGYVYLDSYGDIIFTVNDKKIDIITVDLKSTLLMKINTFFDYTTEKERETLNLRSDGEYIYFDVFINENEYTSYKYNIATKKMV